MKIGENEKYFCLPFPLDQNPLWPVDTRENISKKISRNGIYQYFSPFLFVTYFVLGKLQKDQIVLRKWKKQFEG